MKFREPHEPISLFEIFMYPTLWILDKYWNSKNMKEDGLFGSILVTGVIVGMGFIIEMFLLILLLVGIYSVLSNLI